MQRYLMLHLCSPVVIVTVRYPAIELQKQPGVEAYQHFTQMSNSHGGRQRPTVNTMLFRLIAVGFVILISHSIGPRPPWNACMIARLGS